VPNSSAAASAPVAVPTGFDPCKDISQSVLTSEGLGSQQVDDGQADGGKVLWRGCQWASPDSYGAVIQTTNITVDMVRGKNFPDAQEYAIDGRRAISTRQQDDHPSEACTIDVEIKGGSLEFNLTNPSYLPKTGSQDTCQLGRVLAQKVVATMPAAA